MHIDDVSDLNLFILVCKIMTFVKCRVSIALYDLKLQRYWQN